MSVESRSTGWVGSAIRPASVAFVFPPLPSQCATQAGCTRLGEFAFRVKRVKTP